MILVFEGSGIDRFLMVFLDSRGYTLLFFTIIVGLTPYGLTCRIIIESCRAKSYLTFFILWVTFKIYDMELIDHESKTSGM